MIGKTRNSEKIKALNIIDTLSENNGKAELLEIVGHLYKKLNGVVNADDIEGLTANFSEVIKKVSSGQLGIRLTIRK